MAKYESISDLINVTFQDATNHVSFNTDDIMGLVMPYYWGEADVVRQHNKTSFYETYPESLPIGVTTLTAGDKEVYSGYAQVKSFFAHGGGVVEVYRPSSGFGYQRMTIKSGALSGLAFAQDGKQHDEAAEVSIALKYAGFVPQSLAMGFDNIAIKAEITTIDGYDEPDADKCVKLTVIGCKGSLYAAVTPSTGDNPKAKGWYEKNGSVYELTTDTEVQNGKTYYEYTGVNLEEFVGSSNPNANIEGESLFLEDVVKSDFINVRVFSGVSEAFTADTKVCVAYTARTLETVSAAVKDACKYFRDYERSSATLLINPFVSASDNTDYADIDDAIKDAAERRMNCIAVIGYPTSGSFEMDAIKTYFQASNANGCKFCAALSGRELITLFGYRFTLNCTGGYCGKMINVARTQHLNQVASGYVHGQYGGALKESLLSGEAIELMEDNGINSVYTSNRGNIIFGTRTMYSKQTSYFGKLNVMRVCAAILKNIFPIALETLHTDAASNPITRASLSTMLNSVIDTFINNQDLHDDSEADCSDAINTDYLTRGGTELNIILRLHFIGLVEKVNIKVIATDTSVSAEFV